MIGFCQQMSEYIALRDVAELFTVIASEELVQLVPLIVFFADLRNS